MCLFPLPPHRRVTASSKCLLETGCAGRASSASTLSVFCVRRRAAPWRQHVQEPSGLTSAVPCGYLRWIWHLHHLLSSWPLQIVPQSVSSGYDIHFFFPPCVGEHRLSREDGADHQSLPHPTQPLVAHLQSVQTEDGRVYPGESGSVSSLSYLCELHLFCYNQINAIWIDVNTLIWVSFLC